MKIYNTRKLKVRALLQNLKDGPSISPSPFTTLTPEQIQEVKQKYTFWVESWILPVVEDLLKRDIPGGK